MQNSLVKSEKLPDTQTLFTSVVERDPDIDNLIALLNTAPPNRYQETVGEVFGAYDENATLKYPPSMDKVRESINLDPMADLNEFKLKSLIKLLVAYQSGGKVEGSLDLTKIDVGLLNAQIELLKQKGIDKGKDVGSLIKTSQGALKNILATAESEKTKNFIDTSKTIFKIFLGSDRGFLGNDLRSYLAFLKINDPTGYSNFLDKLRTYWIIKRKERKKLATPEEINQRKLADVEFNQKQYSEKEKKISLMGMAKGVASIGGEIGRSSIGRSSTRATLAPDILNKTAIIENIKNGGYLLDDVILDKVEMFNTYMDNSLSTEKKHWYSSISWLKLTSMILVIIIITVIASTVLFYLIGVFIALVLLYLYYVKPEFSILKQAYIVTFAFAANWLIPLYYFFYKL